MRHFLALILIIYSWMDGNAQVSPNSGTHKMQASSIAHSLQNSSEASKVNPSDLISIDKSGDVSFSIPVVTVKGRKLSIPISANYNAGIKVDQKSSEIGLGWSINFGSITRDYGAFEPDYAETSVEAKMYNLNDSNFGTLSNPGAAGNPFLNNKELIYNNIENYIGTDFEKMTPDNYIVSIPGLGGDIFWNNGEPNLDHDFIWNESSPWKIEYSTKTFVIDQEYSRINELSYQNLPPFNQLDAAGNIAAAICIPPYVQDRYFKKTTNGLILSSGVVYKSEVKYKDFNSFSITNDDGTTYVFGRALRGQKYLFSEDPFWSTMPGLGSGPSDAIYGEWWKIDYIAEWLLTEVKSSDYFDSNNNGKPDENDEGDWIIIEYTDPHQSESIPGFDVASILVPKHREWLNFTQTDKYSSLMRERAYVKKIITPIQEIDFSISQKFDVDHDYFKVPLNNPDLNNPYIYKSLEPPGGGSNDEFHINYPLELMRYDSIIVKDNINANPVYQLNRILSKIVFVYATKGSQEELAVSEYLIRNNNDTETTPYDPAVTGPQLDQNGNFINGFNIEDYKLPTGRGKTTLKKIKYFPENDLNDVQIYHFEYGFNPSLNVFKKHEIIKKNSFPNVRQSLLTVERIPFANFVKLSLLPFSVAEYSVLCPAYGPLSNCTSNVSLNNNLDLNSEIGKDLFGYCYDPSQINQGRHAWTISMIKVPTGGTIQLEYENDEFDYNMDLIDPSDRKTWKDNGSLFDDALPFISHYNKIALSRSLLQGVINSINNSSLKKLYNTYNMPMTNNTGGIRLKKKTSYDGINNPVTILFEYGQGHYKSVPKSYWSNYIEGFSDFITRERLKQESSAAYDPLMYQPGAFGFGQNDYSHFMSHLSLNIRIDNTVNDDHYYKYIDEIFVDGLERPFIRKHFELILTDDTYFEKQKVVALKGYDRGSRPLVQVITNEIDHRTTIGLKKVEKFESQVPQPYETTEYFYTNQIKASRKVNYKNVNLGSFTYPTYTLTGGGKLIIYQPPTAFEITMTSLVDLTASNLLFYESVGFPWEVRNDYLYDMFILDQNIKHQLNDDTDYIIPQFSLRRQQSKLLKISKIGLNHLGVLSEKDFTYEPTFGLIKQIKEDNSKKNVGGTLFNQSLITEYTYGHEDPVIGIQFENKNMLNQKTGINKKLFSNWASSPISDIMKSTAQKWTSANVNGLYNGDQFEYNSEINSTGLSAGTVTTFAPFNINGSNSSQWETRRSEFKFNRFGQVSSSKLNNLFTLNTYGYNYSSPKAIFYQENRLYDATYTGFEDLNKDDGTIPLWSGNRDEFWYDLNIDRNYIPLKSKIQVYVYKNINPLCIISNSGPRCSNSQTPCNSYGSNGYYFSNGDYNVSIDNYSGQWSIGDKVKLTQNLDPEVNVNINGIPFSQSNLPDFETTITNIIYDPSNSAITTTFGFPLGLVNYSNWNDYDYYLCFSDPLPQEYIWHLGVNIEKVNTTENNSFIYKKQAHTGNYSYLLGNRNNSTSITQKTPIRPIRVPGLGTKYIPYTASVWLKKQNLTKPQGDIKFTYRVWNNERTSILDGATIVLEGIGTEWKYFEMPIIRTTAFSGILEVYIENDWTIPQSMNTLFVDDLLIYPNNSKYEYFSFDKNLNITLLPIIMITIEEIHMMIGEGFQNHMILKTNY
ncbi:MAG: hypothetical protein KA536_10250 [Saprospiraceae bacterium]|nr:hypothetical protein [Saprospiraceae bacterium]